MIALVKRQPIIAALAIAAAALVAAIGLETGFGTRLSRAIPAGVSKPAAPFEARLLPPLAASDAERLYPEMAARPLFVPLRRPAPPPEAVAQSTFKRGQFVLQGVIISGGMRIALLREKSTGKIHRVEQGNEVGGVKVAQIDPETVTLAQGSEQEVLPLQVLRVGSTSAVPVTPGPFGPAAGPGAPPQAGGVPVSPGNPVAPSAAVPGSPNPGVPKASFGPQVANPSAQAVPQATTSSMSPEELLARRRARRAQQNP